MAHSFIPVVEAYIRERLTPSLLELGVSNGTANVVAQDIGRRLQSVINCWSDRLHRDTVLVPGIEEAHFYQPLSAPIQLKALVVVAVRNSLLEDIHSTRSSRPELAKGPRIPDSEIRRITTGAIEYFHEASLESARHAASPLGDADTFAKLPEQYPFAWRALSLLAGNTALEQTYEPVHLPAPTLERPPRARRRASERVVLSGIDATLDPVLLDVLDAIRKQELSLFFSDCFKMISRHPGKLFRVVNFVLGHGASVVTSNYLIGPDYISRREPLIRPAHREGDIPANVTNEKGVTAKHRQALRIVVEALG